MVRGRSLVKQKGTTDFAIALGLSPWIVEHRRKNVL